MTKEQLLRYQLEDMSEIIYQLDRNRKQRVELNRQLSLARKAVLETQRELEEEHD